MHALKKKHPCKGEKRKKREKLALLCGFREWFGLFLAVVGGLFDLYLRKSTDSLQYWGDQ